MEFERAIPISDMPYRSRRHCPVASAQSLITDMGKAAECEVRGAGCGVRGVGFEVWGLGFGVRTPNLISK
jgi:hypothetical protein